MVKRHNRLLVAFHVVTDAVLGMGAFVLAYLVRFETFTFDPDRIRQNAQRFSSQVFRERFPAFVERAYQEWRANLGRDALPSS